MLYHKAVKKLSEGVNWPSTASLYVSQTGGLGTKRVLRSIKGKEAKAGMISPRPFVLVCHFCLITKAIHHCVVGRRKNLVVIHGSHSPADSRSEMKVQNCVVSMNADKSLIY